MVAYWNKKHDQLDSNSFIYDTFQKPEELAK